LGADKIAGHQDSHEEEKSVPEMTIQELEILLEASKEEAAKEGAFKEGAGRKRGDTVSPDQHRVMAPDTPWLSAWRLEPLASDSLQRVSSSPRKRQSWRDRLLLFVELVALLGLAIVVYLFFSTLQSLNHETVQVREAPEPTSTPMPVATLPGSSMSPGESHLPPFYQGIVQPANPVPLLTPTLGPQVAIRIVIDKIRVDAPVVAGDDWESLKKGVGHHTGSTNPGQRGNMVVSAHNDVFGEIFRDLDKLEPGDEVLVFTLERSYRYVVKETRIVEPTEIGVMAPSQEPILTLITCYPYMVDTHRVVVVAELSH